MAVSDCVSRLVVTLAVAFLMNNQAAAQLPAVDVQKELFITNLNVVNSVEATSPTGAFHVKTLLDAMAPAGHDAKDVLLSLLTGFRKDSLDLPKRKIDEVILNPWKRWPVGATAPIPETDPLPSDADWNVNWEKAPFRLLAVVNRMDLRRNPNIANAGEGRFVFGMVDPIDGSPLSFTFIFEYRQPITTPSDVVEIAAKWHALGSIPAFNQDYIDALKAVTATFASKDAAPGRPNGSSIGQVRSNEIALNDFGDPTAAGWELREWRIKNDGGLFEPDTVKETPPASLNDTEFLGFLLDRFGTGLPEQLPDAMLGFRGITGLSPAFQWEVPGVSNNDLRLRRFSVHTCSGCHGGDGQTVDGTAFLQVTNREESQEASLSRFLTGISASGTEVVDPATGELKSTFSDLEIRKFDFQTLISTDPAIPTFAERMIQNIQARRSRVH